MLFETERLYIRRLQLADEARFYDLKSNPNVVNPLPRKPLTADESKAELRSLIFLESSSGKKVWCICEKGSAELIGCCGIMANDAGQPEIGYQLREAFWGKGYGTEIAKALIDYGFDVLKLELITADVAAENSRSVKILEKFFTLEKEFFNATDQCTDRRYYLKRENR